MRNKEQNVLLNNLIPANGIMLETQQENLSKNLGRFFFLLISLLFYSNNNLRYWKSEQKNLAFSGFMLVYDLIKERKHTHLIRKNVYLF